MSGGGIIIIRLALQKVLTDPIVSGSLPKRIWSKLAPFIGSDVNSWTQENTDDAHHAFNWYVCNYC